MENSQKRENLLNLALDTEEEERERSQALNVGYDSVQKTWELIVRYTGDIRFLEEEGIRVYQLLGGYGVLQVPESLVDYVTSLPQIEYVEKPKRLFFALNRAKAASCIVPVQSGSQGLSGKGVLVAVIDSGIDYFHPDFRTEGGNTRIVELWDQTSDRVYTQEEINQALEMPDRSRGLELVPSMDFGGHGTAVASIAAGNGRESQGLYRGPAYESPLLIVKLGAPLTDSFPRTTQLMRALDYCVRKAAQLGMPVVVNLSFGNTYGSHDGTSLLERFMDTISGYGRTLLVAGAGNEGNAGGHTSGVLIQGQPQLAEFSVGPYETGFGLQLWKSYADDFQIELITPGGESVGIVRPELGRQTLHYRNTQILLFYGEPSPYSQSQEIYLDFIPRQDYIDSGIWALRLTPRRVVQGRYDLWLPAFGVLNPGTQFLRPNPDITLTIPATAASALTVGAYDDSYNAYADFSGRGFTRLDSRKKPDLAAPGVDVVAARAGGGYEPVTGTSFAAPMAAGAAALLMEWGIVRGNDPFLYGEKVKAYLIRGARQLPGFDSFPNPSVGWGALCLRDSFPPGAREDW